MRALVVSEKHSKTKTSFYRRLYIVHLIESGINTVPAIIEQTGMPRRTAQDTILAMKELGIQYEFVGGTRSGYYQINDWGAVNRQWVESHLKHVLEVLVYP